jgi:hypothetical protein
MRKALGIAVVAISLIGGATVVLAQSSRDLTDVTGTEANRLKTQYVATPLGLAPMRTRRACTDDGTGLTGAGDSTCRH